ncbi:diaminopimelate dehydrogenase [Wohlfahrtiimonas chitiniclastica]|uniref:Meso-diaminopimelate D-dehydrogenase n=1 Tax=Wohlfahrtiimonas chitiniclastica TaxID=400946 RepID=A0AB35BXZ0_9GAMM|nr:diaminopimelate dehydrogenase [Wohlfahrtiimonas chitiniclastica]KZX37916.1 diaminopimelate dehydrogenase [Wohlfahrtiimonas chitiniclastica]MBS7816274.1 diaminopimelate dehydrogenase [Wohlfahrtiimonas chitiniclastica]MBS7821731.1 diaminopimelate dehydrogenase [Wohlfahrtiimonas chitiniclastica]MBS7823911.1 diaminopimelate dehydrogenase [Wohlfahrtiimonas chitiniclastica]MBS7829523.1 diaminopimelate dehydrogenase [Wohlfahrtiimonas chitiniclastica]
MKKINAIVVGSGNVGLKVIDILLQTKDFNLVGAIRRSGEPIAQYPNVVVKTSVDQFSEKIDVAFLAIPTRQVPTQAKAYLAKGIHTVDSYDIHSSILEVRSELNEVARANNAVAIVSSGWDPGTDSIVRAMLMAMAPNGMTYTNFGPGMSMGHTVAVKAIEGVKDALSMTMPTGAGVHRRMVYVELSEGATPEIVENLIKTDPYFIHDETHVKFVDDVNLLKDVGHGVELTRKGASGTSGNQNFMFKMSIDNPALTAQVMVSSGRAAMRQEKGAYTLIEIPVVDFLEGEREDWIKALV